MTHKPDNRVTRMTTAHKLKKAYKTFADALQVATRLLTLGKYRNDGVYYNKSCHKAELLSMLDARRKLLA